MRASPVITVEVTGYWLTLRSSGGLSRPMVHRLDWLPPNGATSVSARARMPASVNREAITRRGKNVMRYYAATAAPFNEVRRGPRSKEKSPAYPLCRRNQSEFNAPVRQLRRPPSSASRRCSHRSAIRRTSRSLIVRERLIEWLRLTQALHPRRNGLRKFSSLYDSREYRVSDIISLPWMTVSIG